MTQPPVDHALLTHDREDFPVRLRRLASVRFDRARGWMVPLAVEVGVSNAYVQDMLYRARRPSRRVAVRLASTLRVNIEYLLCGTGLP